METTIYFFRHAQSQPTSQIPHTDWPLSELGTKQASQLPNIAHPLNIEHVISSPYIRCIDTIKPFIDLHDIPITIHQDIRESLISKTVIENFYEVWIQYWNDFTFKLSGCESSIESQSRFVKAVEETVLKHQGKTIAISTHGNVLGLFLNYIDPHNHIEEARKLRNPDILRVVHRESRFLWDRDFRAQGLDDIATHPDQTPKKE